MPHPCLVVQTRTVSIKYIEVVDSHCRGLEKEAWLILNGAHYGVAALRMRTVKLSSTRGRRRGESTSESGPASPIRDRCNGKLTCNQYRCIDFFRVWVTVFYGLCILPLDSSSSLSRL